MIKRVCNNKNRTKIFWITLWLVMIFITLTQGVADPLEGPYPPIGY